MSQSRAETAAILGLTMKQANAQGVTDAEWAMAMSRRSWELAAREDASVRDREIDRMRTARDMIVMEIESYPADTTEEQDMLDNIVLNLRASW